MEQTVELFSKIKIKQRIKELGIEITNNYNKSDEIIIICLLKGAFIFASDLIREIDRDIKIEFMNVSSYGNNTFSSCKVNILHDINIDIKNKNVIIIDDIIDTGHTLFEIRKILRERGPKKIELCTLLDKKEGRKVIIDVNYNGFECPNKFVVGYGMDAGNKYRNLPNIVYINS